MTPRTSDLIHTSRSLLWICANTTWMIGEFYYNDMTRPLAKVFFFAGLTLLAIYYLWAWTRRKDPELPDQATA